MGSQAVRRRWRSYRRYVADLWRRHPVLMGVRAAFAVALGVVSWMRLLADERVPGLSLAAVCCIVGMSVCYVIRVRRDHPEP